MTAPVITTDGQEDNQDVNLIDPAAIKRIVQQTFYPPPGSKKPATKGTQPKVKSLSPSATTVDVLNGGVRHGLAGAMAQALTSAGYKTGKVGNTTLQTTTQVLYGTRSGGERGQDRRGLQGRDRYREFFGAGRPRGAFAGPGRPVRSGHHHRRQRDQFPGRRTLLPFLTQPQRHLIVRQRPGRRPRDRSVGRPLRHPLRLLATAERIKDCIQPAVERSGQLQYRDAAPEIQRIVVDQFEQHFIYL